MKTLARACALLSFFLFAASAHAFPYFPEIDFRDTDLWSDADERISFTGSQSGIDLTVNAMPSPARLWWDHIDGLGVRLSYEPDEIEAMEILGVSFHHSVSLSAIYVSDLFEERGYVESGAYRINGGAWVGFDAVILPGSNDNGEHIIAFGTPIDRVNMVEFSAPGRFSGENHEFALMGFDATPVPEPTTALLLATGLAGLAAAGRRRSVH